MTETQTQTGRVTGTGPSNVHELTIDAKSESVNARCFLAVGPNCWGKGLTKEKAIANARKYKPSWVKGKVQWIVFYCHPSSYVDDMGTLCSFQKFGVPERIEN